MRIIDLTHLVYSDMPVFPGTEQPIFQTANTLEQDGFIEKKITMYSHTGTHIDAPAHILNNGLTLDRLEIDHFIGSSVILNYSGLKSNTIDIDSLKQYEEKIRKVEFVIIKTGWSEYWGSKKYFEEFPSLSQVSAQWLAEFNLKGIGVDTISIDDIHSTTFTIHKAFMRKNALIIENLTNLNLVENEYFTLSVLPLKTKDADGSPVRAVAIVN